jgi:hypothetical protein
MERTQVIPSNDLSLDFRPDSRSGWQEKNGWMFELFASEFLENIHKSCMPMSKHADVMTVFSDVNRLRIHKFPPR